MRRLLPVLVLVATAACGGGGAGEHARTTAPTTTAATASPSTGPASAAVPAVLNWEAKAVAGGQVTGATYTGRAVALWFWAPW